MPTAVKNDVHADMHIQAVDVQYVFFEVKHHDIHALFVWIIRHQPAVRFSQNKPTISIFSQNKPAPVITHQPPAKRTSCMLDFVSGSAYLQWLYRSVFSVSDFTTY
jgi:hypothetical protein